MQLCHFSYFPFPPLITRQSSCTCDEVAFVLLFRCICPNGHAWRNLLQEEMYREINGTRELVSCRNDERHQGRVSHVTSLSCDTT